MLDGDPGLGKSTLLIDIAARVTTHGVHFNGKQGPTGHVILLSAEDGPEDTDREFLRLTAFLSQLAPEVAKDVFARLYAGGRLMRCR